MLDLNFSIQIDCNQRALALLEFRADTIQHADRIVPLYVTTNGAFENQL